MKNFIIVFIGAGIGGCLRYAISLLLKSNGSFFPWATLAVNLIGCFVMGIAISYGLKHQNFSDQYKLVITTGLCGGFTTFSAFGAESIELLKQGNIALAVGYILCSVLIGLLMVWLGSNANIV